MSHPAIEILDREHRVIEWVLEAIEAANQKPPDWGIYERAIAFLGSYAEKMHHDLEESLLFPAMAGAGVPGDRGPIGCMMEEHVDAKTLLDSMRRALSAMDNKEIRVASGAYCALLREHIAKEDNIIYPMAEKSLDASALGKLEIDMRELIDSQSERKQMESLASRLRRSTVSR